MYTLIDTFNNNTILSNHRTLANALKAQQKDAKRLRTRPGSGGYSYVTYKIVKSDNTPITRDEMIEAEIAAGIY
jgi:hypothetical protein